MSTHPVDLESLRGHTPVAWRWMWHDGKPGVWWLDNFPTHELIEQARTHRDDPAKVEYAFAESDLLTERRARDAKVAELLRAATKLDGRVARDGENTIDRFERIAAMFRRETGFVAPGKDAPAASYAGEEHESERDAAWNAWSKAPFDELRAALAAFKEPTPCAQ